MQEEGVTRGVRGQGSGDSRKATERPAPPSISLFFHLSSELTKRGSVWKFASDQDRCPQRLLNAAKVMSSWQVEPVNASELG